MSKKLKQRMGREVGATLAGSASCVVLGYRSLSGETSSRVRSRLRRAKIELTVVRTRVAHKAIAGTPREGLRPLLKGPTVVATGGEDAAFLAKAVVEGTKGEPGFEFRGGWAEGRVVTGAEVQALAKLPGRLELLSMIASAVAAPITNVAFGIDAVLAGVARAVEAVREKKSKEESGAAA